MPAISILLPTWNGARFLPAQLATIRAQSFEDWELLAIDDGSSDASPAILAAAAADDDRIRVLPSAGNRGQTDRLRELAATASAPLIAVSDQDDLWAPDKLERLNVAMVGAEMAYGTSRIIDAEDRDRGYALLDALGPIPGPDDRLHYLFKASVSAHAMLTRRQWFSPASLSRSLSFDWLQSLDAVFAGSVVHVPQAVTMHRLHGGNLSDNKDVDRARSWGERLDPRSFRRSRNRRHFERWTFAQRLEFLAYSAGQTETTRRVARQALRRCERGWFLHDRADPQRALLDLLLPLAGSDADADFARAEIVRLCRSANHPRSIVNDVRHAIGTRTPPREKTV